MRMELGAYGPLVSAGSNAAVQDGITKAYGRCAQRPSRPACAIGNPKKAASEFVGARLEFVLEARL